MSTGIQSLYELAHEAGVLTSFHTWKGKPCMAKPDVLLSVLRMLGVDINAWDQASAALLVQRRKHWSTMVPPVAVAWDGSHAILELRLPANAHGDDATYAVDLTFESGETSHQSGRLADLMVKQSAELDGQTFVSRLASVPIGQLGYHRLRVSVGERSGECLIIGTPTAAYRLPRGKRWGAFAPLYAVRRPGAGAAGDLGDLGQLADWAGNLGASFIGTLPLLASYLSEPFEPSPYSPVSRLFWNELYLDLATAPGFAGCEPARAVLGSARYLAEAAALEAMPLCDYRRQMALRRSVIEPLADAAWESSALSAEIEAFMAANTRADDYARFRAATEARGEVWLSWTGKARDGELDPGDFDERARRYHLYVQYAMNAQLARFGQEGRAALYLDLPVGVNRAGYDTWRDRQSFAMEASAGAPPDALFSGGQNWGLPPLQPQRLREHGYRYFIDSVRNHVAHAGILRVDHAMGVHRLYWIPEGVAATDGIYVHYNAGEMYAIIGLESHRHQCAVVGEDLGTVPDYVRPAMQRHGLSRLYVAQFSLPGADGQEIISPPAEAVASINTHDTPTLAGFWRGSDIDELAGLGLYTAEEAAHEHAARKQMCRVSVRQLHKLGFLASPDPGADNLAAIMRALTEYLGASEAEMVQVNLEDLWLEPDPQNVPGTGHERPTNWRRKMARTSEQIMTDASVLEIVRALQATRRRSS